MKKQILFLSILLLFTLREGYSQSWDMLYQKCTEYYNKGDYPTSIFYAEKTLAQAEKEFGRSHKNYVKSLSNLGLLYSYTGNYSKAESLLTDALNLSEQLPRHEDADFASLLNNLGLLYTKTGNYAKAETVYIRSLDVIRREVGSDQPAYSITLNNLAEVYVSTARYSKAEPLYIEALNIVRRKLGTNNADFARDLNNLGLLYIYKGNYAKAEPLIVEALNINKKVLGPDHPDYGTSLNNLAVLYSSMGYYAKAEPLLIEAMKIREKVVGPDHIDYAGSLNSLAQQYCAMGNYSKAEPLLIRSLNIVLKALGAEHPIFSKFLNDLASLYENTFDYKNAERLYIDAMNFTRNSLGPDHPDYARYLNNLGLLYNKMGEYTKAEPLLVESINLNEKIFGRSHPNYAGTLSCLATMYYDLGNYEKAKTLYIEALNITEKAFGTDHPNYNKAINNLAEAYFNMGNYEKAEPLFLQANEKLNNQIENNFNFLSESEKEQFLLFNVYYYFNVYNSFFLKRMEQNPSLAAISYNNELAHKGMLLQSNTALRQAIYGGGNNALINIYDQFTDVRKKLSILYTMPIAQRKENVDSLENIANVLEKELIIKGKDLPGVENLSGLTRIGWQNVQQALKQGEAAIEFINFNYINKRYTDSILYCALLIRKDYKYPKMIYLFEEKQLQELLSTPKAVNSASYITQLYSNKSDIPPGLVLLPGQNKLYKLAWQPIDSQLKGISTIYLAPTGILNKVSFNAIAVTDSLLLSDKYEINLVSSTRILTQRNRIPASFSSNYQVALYGGIEYDIDSTEMISLTRQYQKSDYNMFSGRSIAVPDNNRGMSWSFLPGTLTEVSDIQKLFNSKRITTSLYTGKNANEESFKHLTGNRKSPEIIHIATHGFFFPEIRPMGQEMGRSMTLDESIGEPVFTYVENPLFRSGILLAGASRSWRSSHPITGIEDGILTAYEVSNMNLSNTKLAVLSACETGLGDIRGTEGVYGLQRAFKIAGVQYIIMSLWQVPDYQTSELMRLFYSNCLNGMTIREGFKAAQHTMRKKYDPFYWAAFVLKE